MYNKNTIKWNTVIIKSEINKILYWNKIKINYLKKDFKYYIEKRGREWAVLSSPWF